MFPRANEEEASCDGDELYGPSRSWSERRAQEGYSQRGRVRRVMVTWRDDGRGGWCSQCLVGVYQRLWYGVLRDAAIGKPWRPRSSSGQQSHATHARMAPYLQNLTHAWSHGSPLAPGTVAAECGFDVPFLRCITCCRLFHLYTCTSWRSQCS
jgi:hypothetical protein